MNRDQLKEQLELQRNMQSHLWTAIMITISGTLALSFNLKNFYDKFMIFTGFVTFILLINLYLNKIIFINRLISQLKEDSKDA